MSFQQITFFWYLANKLLHASQEETLCTLLAIVGDKMKEVPKVVQDKMKETPCTFLALVGDKMKETPCTLLGLVGDASRTGHAQSPVGNEHGEGLIG